MAKKFSVTQTFDRPAADVAAVLTSRSTWERFENLPFVGTPNLLAFDSAELIEIAMAYRVDIDLPPLATNFIDPAKMSFVEKTRLDPAGNGSFVIVPDHYQSLLRASGSSNLRDVGGSAERTITGSIDVRLGWAGKLFEGPVEEAIVNGFSQALEAQAAQILGNG